MTDQGFILMLYMDLIIIFCAHNIDVNALHTLVPDCADSYNVADLEKQPGG